MEEAVKFLRQECELCTNIMAIKEVVKMLNCQHKCCTTCANNFFTVVIKDQNISAAVCPFCQEPSNLADDDDVALAYCAKCHAPWEAQHEGVSCSAFADWKIANDPDNQ